MNRLILTIFVALTLFSSCIGKTPIDKGLCIQRCVKKMISYMAESDHNIFYADTVREVQRTCEKNLVNVQCTSSGSWAKYPE